MQILRTAAVVAVAVAHTLGQCPRVTRSESVLVTAVLDGDTITVTNVGRVRLLGIDAPEISHGLDTAAPFGREARDRLSALLLHRWVRLETDGQTVDAYNRHLAYVVTEDGQCVNTLLVREGLARVSARTPLARLDELKQAEAAAQSMRRGMWGTPPPAPPTSYTRRPTRKRSAASPSAPSEKRARKKKPEKKPSS
jgi:endonuclease YncB( thermonuclease family)